MTPRDMHPSRDMRFNTLAPAASTQLVYVILTADFWGQLLYNRLRSLLGFVVAADVDAEVVPVAMDADAVKAGAGVTGRVFAVHRGTDAIRGHACVVPYFGRRVSRVPVLGRRAPRHEQVPAAGRQAHDRVAVMNDAIACGHQ